LIAIRPPEEESTGMRRARTVLCLGALVIGISAPFGAVGAIVHASASSPIGFGKSLLQLFTSANPTSSRVLPLRTQPAGASSRRALQVPYGRRPSR